MKVEDNTLNDAIRKSSHVAWSLGGYGIVYMVASLWIVDLIYKLYVSYLGR
jgi:hypothetical protein